MLMTVYLSLNSNQCHVNTMQVRLMTIQLSKVHPNSNSLQFSIISNINLQSPSHVFPVSTLLPHYLPTTKLSTDTILTSKAMVQSSCLCGANVITFSGPPDVRFKCHCLDERKLTGAAFSLNALYPSADLKVLQGTRMLSISMEQNPLVLRVS